MFPGTTQQFKIYPALAWRQISLSLIPVSCCNLIKQTPHISISIPNHTSSFPRQLFASFLFCCCWEFWARTIQTLMVVVGNFHFERGGAFLVSAVPYLIQKCEFSNFPQVQCLGLHKLKSWSGAEVCLCQAWQLWQLPALPYWASHWWDDDHNCLKHKHRHLTYWEGKQLISISFLFHFTLKSPLYHLMITLTSHLIS